MIKKIYSEWYDQEDGHVYSIAETRFLGILIHQFKTSTNSWNVISGYIAQQEADNGLYTNTNLGFKPTNEQKT